LKTQAQIIKLRKVLPVTKPISPITKKKGGKEPLPLKEREKEPRQAGPRKGEGPSFNFGGGGGGEGRGPISTMDR